MVIYIHHSWVSFPYNISSYKCFEYQKTVLESRIINQAQSVRGIEMLFYSASQIISRISIFMSFDSYLNMGL